MVGGAGMPVVVPAQLAVKVPSYWVLYYEEARKRCDVNVPIPFPLCRLKDCVHQTC